MKLSDKAIQEFREIFRREFKRVLSDDEAQERAESFMRLILLLLRPYPPSVGSGQPVDPVPED